MRENRFGIALGIYGLIAILEWFTLEGRIRIVALVVLALFAVRTWVHEKRRALEASNEREASRER